MKKVTVGRILIILSLLLQSLHLFLRKYLSDDFVRVSKILAFIFIAVGLVLVISPYFSKKKPE
mgnify:CR=1 FL=1